jgi:hypothetical protein
LMVKALDRLNWPVLGWEAERGAEYFCPACQEGVVQKSGPLVTPHFAHQAGSGCAWGTGESERHHEMKAQLGKLFAGRGVDYEVPLVPGRRADVVLRERFVIECQESAISVTEWTARMADYSAAGCYVLWVWDVGRLVKAARGQTFQGLLDLVQDEAFGFIKEIRIPAEVRHCHRQSFGKVYVLDKAGVLRSCHLRPATARVNEGGPAWDESSYTPRTLKRLMLHDPPLRLGLYRGVGNEMLIHLGEGVWWK